MGKFYTTKFPTNVISRITQLSDWFNAFDGITSEVVDLTVDNIQFTGAKVTIDGTDIEVYLGDRPTAITNSYAYIKLGDYMLASQRTTGGGNESGINATAYIDENCILLCACQNVNGFEILYTKTNDNKYLLGGKVSVNGNSLVIDDISKLTYIEIGDESHAPLYYANMFPYNAEAGTIDYTVGGIFVDGVQFKHFKTEALVECSTVSLLTTQSLIIGNCVALGPHCLAPLDMEEEEGSE